MMEHISHVQPIIFISSECSFHAAQLYSSNLNFDHFIDLATELKKKNEAIKKRERNLSRI